METLILIFVILQAVGAIVGAGGAIIGELSYFRAIRDGHVDRAERDHLSVIASALRIGMLLVLLSSIGLVLVDYIGNNAFQPALSASYWSEMTLALVIIWASWALSRRRVAFWLGSSAVFTCWWVIALLALGRFPNIGFVETLLFTLVVGVVIAGILGYARSLYPRLTEPREL